MCNQCAEKMGGIFPKGHVCTVMKGTCLYCDNKDQVLIPWVDFNWPKDNEIDVYAKAGRD